MLDTRQSSVSANVSLQAFFSRRSGWPSLMASSCLSKLSFKIDNELLSGFRPGESPGHMPLPQDLGWLCEHHFNPDLRCSLAGHSFFRFPLTFGRQFFALWCRPPCFYNWPPTKMRLPIFWADYSGGQKNIYLQKTAIELKVIWPFFCLA